MCGVWSGRFRPPGQIRRRGGRHREWSDEEVVKAMNEAGAKFGPEHKAELLRALPLEGLAPFMGGEIEVVSAEFRARLLGSREPALIWWVRPIGTVRAGEKRTAP